MANTVLTATQVTRKALFILHQKLNFVGSITRDYDDSFAVEGAKIGSTLKIRKPNQFTVRSGAVMATQDMTETTVDLAVNSQKGVDMAFSATDLTLSLDDFATRVLEPAMSVLASVIEADAMSMYLDVYNQVNNIGSAATFAKVLAGRKMLVDSLAPLEDRVCNLNTQDNVDMVNDLKGLFQDSASISKQFKEGYLGRTAGMDFMENTLWPTHTCGTDANAYRVNGANQTGSSITVDTGTGTFTVGDIITFVGCYRVHPESKVSTGVLHNFVVTAASGANATTISISPAIVTSGPTQNCSASPTTGSGGIVTKQGGNGVTHGISLAYHKQAFAFATADLVLPKGLHFAAREVMDGISMRILSDYDMINDKIGTRIDVLYGYKTLRPGLAVRLANN